MAAVLKSWRLVAAGMEASQSAKCKMQSGEPVAFPLRLLCHLALDLRELSGGAIRDWRPGAVIY